MTKERIVIKALDEVQKRVEFLEHELFRNDPLSNQCSLYGKFNDFLKEKKGKERTTKESIKFINDLDKQMTAQKERQKTYDADKIQKELVTLQIELNELMNEKFTIDQMKKRNEGSNE